MEIQDIKASLNIETVLKHYGLQADKNGMLKCPFHVDETASMKIYTQTNTFNCFGCGKNGDQIEFCTLKEGNKHKGLLKATELSGDIKPINNKPKQSINQPKGDHTEILTRIFSYFQNGLNSATAKRPKEYLQSRNLNHEILELGYNSGQFHHRGGISETDKQACIDAGLLIPYNGNVPNANGTNHHGGQAYTPFAKDCIIFPLKNKQNQIVSIYGRSITNNDKSKHYYLKDRTGLYPGYPKLNTTKLILTEAIIDAASLLQIPEITAEYEILSCYGTNGLTEEHTEAIKNLKNLKEIIFFFDGDEAGIKAITKYEEVFKKLRPELELSAVITPDNEDINSLSVGHEPEIFTHLLNERIPLLKQVEKGMLTKELFLLTENKSLDTCLAGRQANSSVLKAKLNTRNPDYITLEIEDLLFTLLGGINLQQLDRLRVTLKINRTDTGNPLHSIRHSIDLYQSDYLEKLINKASEQLETSTTSLRKAMAELIEQVEHYRLSKMESKKEQKPKFRELSPERGRRAIKYLSDPKLMERTNEDVGKTGVVGERNNRLLMYLVFTSRLREQPLHIVSLGASGTGKTYLQEKVAELIPENDKLEITVLSENAFYYFGQTELKHKLVLIEDLDGAKEVLYPIRELQTKRWITKTIPIKDSKGNLKTITLRVEGPICLAGTTTRERLYEDNANRSLLIYLDSTPEHKELIMEYQRMLSAGKINRPKEQELKEFFKDMQSVLKPIKVRNPYAEFLKLPEYIFKPLRTNSHYLAFIETVTFYHQYQREVKTDPRTGEQYIETTLEDIEWTNKLLKDILLAKSDELPKALRDFFESLKRWVKRENKVSFYAKEVQEYLRMYPMKVSRYMRELELRSFIRKAGGNKKSGFEYEIHRWDDYEKLQSGTEVLDEILKKLRSQKKE